MKIINQRKTNYKTSKLKIVWYNLIYYIIIFNFYVKQATNNIVLYKFIHIYKGMQNIFLDGEYY